MAVEVALAMLQRDGRWLMQLRDEIPTIVAPGCWGLFGGHLDPGETPEQALRRELLEEISWQPPELELVMVHHIHRRTAHVFRAELSVPWSALRNCWLEPSGAAVWVAIALWRMDCWR